jgi:hypothetical protein
MCQPEACSTLAAAATLLIEEGILVVNCHTGFHRAESCAAVIAASLSKSGQYTVLHLSLCRDKMSDLHHSVGVAIKWMASPWCESMHTSAPWDGLQQACLTRPEAWQCWADFQQWVACTAEADAKSWAACAAAANATSSSSGSLATTPKAAAKPSMKKKLESPKKRRSRTSQPSRSPLNSHPSHQPSSRGIWPMSRCRSVIRAGIVTGRSLSQGRRGACHDRGMRCYRPTMWMGQPHCSWNSWLNFHGRQLLRLSGSSASSEKKRSTMGLAS